VKAAKAIISKARSANEDPYLMLLEQWNTPSQTIGYSPAQRMHSRRMRTLLPTIANALIPIAPNPEEVSKRLQERRANQKSYYDRTTKVLPELQPGEEVWVQCVPQQPNKWIKGVVRSKFNFRAYDVEVDGAIRRRNRIHLRKQTTTPNSEDTSKVQEAGCTRSGCVYQKRKDVI
jgi:hypothetical protein